MTELTKDNVDELTAALVEDGFAVRKRSTSEVDVYLDEYSCPSTLTVIFQKYSWIPLFIDTLPAEDTFVTRVELTPVTTLDEVDDE